MITSKVERHLFFLKEENRNEILMRQVNWDDNPIGLVTLYRTYLRRKDNEQLETWNECVLRVIEGMFSFQKTHVINSGLIWDEERAQNTAMIAATKLFEFKWSPPGRGLWMMGTDFVWEKGGAALNNCGFTSTEDIDKEFSAPFKFLMDFSMVGVGIGFDTKGAGKITIKEPVGETITIVVPDSREGWVDAVGSVIDSYFKGTNPIEIDTSLIRKYGEPIRGFGGIASGPGPLIQGINGIKDILNNQIGNKISSVTITDIQNIIGKIVIAGNVRRCLPSNTLVQVDYNSWKPIKDITTQDKVFINDTYHPVKEVVDQGEQEVLKITLSSLDYLESTRNHRWYVLNRNTGNCEWVMAKDLDEYHEFMDDIDSIITYPVWSVTSNGVKQTTDLVIDSKDHAFIAMHPDGKGVGISHNTAEIAFSEANDSDFRNMKSWTSNPVSVGSAPPPELKEVSEEDYNFYSENMFSKEGISIVEKYSDYPWSYKFGGWRWASNNSVFAIVGMDYTDIARSIGENGEPGIAWLENMQNYSRMNNGPDYKDKRVKGGNPCLEQSLESKELCCLVETYPSRHQSAKEFYETLKVAYLYAKTVTLIATHNQETNTIICRNRRIGTSQSGIIDAIYKFGRFYYQKNMLDIAYDKVREFDTKYSEWLGVPKSIKTTSVKPSGCATPDGLVRIVTIDGYKTQISYDRLFKIAGINLDNYKGQSNIWFYPSIENIPKVYDKNDERQKITGFYINGEAEVYEVEFEDGIKYKFTGEHKLLLTSGEWKRVDELEEGDDIMQY